MLCRREAYARGRSTNVELTQRAFDHDEDLVGVFRDFVDGKYEALDEELIARKLQR